MRISISAGIGREPFQGAGIQTAWGLAETLEAVGSSGHVYLLEERDQGAEVEKKYNLHTVTEAVDHSSLDEGCHGVKGLADSGDPHWATNSGPPVSQVSWPMARS